MWKAASQTKSRTARAKALWQVGMRWTQEQKEGQNGQNRSRAVKLERGQWLDHPRLSKVRSFIFTSRATEEQAKDFEQCVCVCVCARVCIQACVTDQISIKQRPQDGREISKPFL